MTLASRTRRSLWLAALLLVPLLAGATIERADAADLKLRIGVQKYGTLVILQQRGTLEKRLQAQGSVDAWVIWDPFLAAAQEATQARVLRDGSGLVSNHQFYLASRAFADAHPDLVQAVLSEITEVDRWASTHQEEVAELLSPRTGISVASLKIALARLGYGVTPLDDAVVAEQQRIADSFHELGLIPTRISVRDAVWTGPKS